MRGINTSINDTFFLRLMLTAWIGKTMELNPSSMRFVIINTLEMAPLSYVTMVQNTY